MNSRLCQRMCEYAKQPKTLWNHNLGPQQYQTEFQKVVDFNIFDYI